MRPPRPWRPSKLRFDVEAQRSPGASVSGFMPRHIEQPAPRQSKPGRAEDLVQALALGLGLHLRGARHDHRVHVRRDLAAVDDLGRDAQVADPGVRARADEDAVERDAPASACRPAGPCSAAHARGRRPGAPGTQSATPTTMSGVVPHVTCGLIAPTSTVDLAIERSRRRRSSGPATRPGSRRRARRPTRTSCRPARSCPRGRRPRSSCCRRSCGPPSRAPRSTAPAYSTTWPVAPATPIWPIVARMRSFAVTPKPISPS